MKTTIVPNAGEKYTTKEIVYELSLQSELLDIVNPKGVTDETGNEEREVLSVPDK